MKPLAYGSMARLAGLTLTVATLYSCASVTPSPSAGSSATETVAGLVGTPGQTPAKSGAAFGFVAVGSPTASYGFATPSGTSTAASTASSNRPAPGPGGNPPAPTPVPSIAGFTFGPATPPPTPTQTLAPTPTQTPTPTAVPSPTASPTRSVTVTIAAAGDIACDPSANVGAPQRCDQAATADLVAGLHPTAVLPLGDNQYEDGTLAAYQAVYAPTWGRFFKNTYPTVGNHEYLTSKAQGYFDYFKLPAYYAYNLGNWHLVSLDSSCSQVGGCGPGSPQEKWLRQNLAQYPRQCTLVYWHEPRWSSGALQNANQMATIWADLVAANVDVVLSGHNHSYERFAPLDANGSPDPTGVTEFVVGTGGKNHTSWATRPLTGEVVRDSTSFGVLSMRLSATGYSWRFVPAPGYSFTDSGSASCH